MTSLKFKSVVALVVSGSMFLSSTAAVAATVPASAPQQIAPWAALSILSAGAPAAAVCGASDTTAQAVGARCLVQAVDPAQPAPAVDNGPPPPTPIPPVEPPSEGLGLGVSPLLLGLVAIAAGAALYFLVIKKKKASSPA